MKTDKAPPERRRYPVVEGEPVIKKEVCNNSKLRPCKCCQRWPQESKPYTDHFEDRRLYCYSRAPKQRHPEHPDTGEAPDMSE